nr:PIG-L family deacetylase [Deltaproteobacteria bacterium]
MTTALAMALLAPVALSQTRQPQQQSAGGLLREIEHLRVVGSVLYVAAHPDDENTRLLAWLVGERGLDATYLSLTRGDGGQNLIGTEQAELLGVVRTGELLAARRIDGADQRFTRARDFGYSKSAEEALASWGHAAALSDVVRAIRELQPDVVITRFGPDDDTHGHHVASAILAAEAFEKAADPGYRTEGLGPWQADRLVRNQSSWRIDASTDTSKWLSVDVGGYDPRTGRSWSEIAADSRTMHKSQGFGSAPAAGPQREYFAAVAGNVPPVGADLFDGLDLGWSRIEGTGPLDRALDRAADRFDPRDPAGSLPDLARAHGLLDELEAGPWVARKRADLEAVMAGCAGLWLTARADTAAVTPGGTLKVTLT